MTRARPKPTSSSSPSVDSTLDKAVASISFAVTHLDEKIRLIASGKAEASKHDDESRIAHLATRVGTLVDALRKVETTRRKRVESLTLPMVIAFLRTLSEDDRARVIREMQTMNARGGVLG